MNKDPIIFLQHILNCIRRIESFSKGMTKKRFESDEKTQSAIFRQIEIIGEAVKNLPIDYAVKYPHIEWAKIAATRNRLIHAYFEINLDLVWEMLEKDIPKLKKDILEIIKDLEIINEEL